MPWHVCSGNCGVTMDHRVLFSGQPRARRVRSSTCRRCSLVQRVHKSVPSLLNTSERTFKGFPDVAVAIPDVVVAKCVSKVKNTQMVGFAQSSSCPVGARGFPGFWASKRTQIRPSAVSLVLNTPRRTVKRGSEGESVAWLRAPRFHWWFESGLLLFVPQ